MPGIQMIAQLATVLAPGGQTAQPQSVQRAFQDSLKTNADFRQASSTQFNVQNALPPARFYGPGKIENSPLHSIFKFGHKQDMLLQSLDKPLRTDYAQPEVREISLVLNEALHTQKVLVEVGYGTTVLAALKDGTVNGLQKLTQS
jgi:hypothetical protein